MPRKKTEAQLDREIAEVTGHNPNGHRRGGGDWKGSEVQSLLFDRSQWTPRSARAWAKKHGYRSVKVHETDNYIRLRQFAPVGGTEKRTITFGRGIRAVVEQVR